MAKKLADIENDVKAEASNFRGYIINSLSEQVRFFLKELSQHCKIYIFSGVIRDYFLKKEGIRDLDLVIDGELDIEALFLNYSFRKNSFGGYKLSIDDTSIDLWFIKNTWAVKHRKITPSNLETFIPTTSFFNFSSIVYDFEENKFICAKPFLSFLKNKEINIVFKHHDNIPLCIVNSLHYSNKLDLKIATKLIKFLKLNFNRKYDYREVQIKHFGKVLYSNEDLKNWIKSLNP